jgi:hypothetical protein
MAEPYAYSRLNKDDAIVLMADHQAGLISLVQDYIWAAETGTRADRKSGDGSGHARAMAERDDVAITWRPPTLPSDLREGAAPARQRHGRTAVMRSDAPVHHSQ